MLLLLLGLLHVTQGSEPSETLRKHVEVCPMVGYFFERQPSGSTPGPCYLCYCKGDGEAVCTLRDSERCDEENSYQSEIEQTTVRRHRPRKHRRRPRRSPGIMDIFFNDEKKDQLLKGMAQSNNEDCVPKSSKSIGCPPKNWCTGCLVCECDNDRQWQCHVMSFCDDDYKTLQSKPKNKKKSKNIPVRESKTRKDDSTKSETKKKIKSRSIRQKKSNNIYKDIHKHKSAEKTLDMTKNKTQPLISVKTKMSYAAKSNASKVLIIKKYISTLSPIHSPELSKFKNDPSKLAQILYQQYGSSTEATNAGAQRLPKESKSILINEFLNKDKPKYDGDNAKYTGEETTTAKQKLKFRRKSNMVSRKPRNADKFNTEDKDLNETREKTNLNKFYHKQTDLMGSKEETVSQVKQIKRNEKTMNKEDIIANYEQMDKNKLIALASRRKRDVPLRIEESNYGYVNETDNEAFSPSYAYTVDSPVTTHDDSRELKTSDKEYETTTLQYDDRNTFSDNNRKNLATNINTESYSPDYTTTKISAKLSNNTEAIIIVTPETLEYVTETTTSAKTDADIYIPTSKKYTNVTKRNLHNTSGNLSIPLDNSDLNKTLNIVKNGISKDMNNTFTDFNKCKFIRLMKKSKTDTVNNNSVPLNIPVNTKISHKDHSNNYIYKPKLNRMVPIKFLKKIYGKLLLNQKNETYSNNYAAMESICDTFGPCQISTKNVEKIYSKINELISETKRSLNIIKTMKDLLQIIKAGNNNTDIINDTAEYKGYVNKLNDILTDTSATSLTEAQKIYNMYVKTNTTDLFDSVGKFAFILNDILKIIRSDKLKYDYINKRRNKIKQNAVHEQLRKIKNAIRKFHVFQNTFMLKLYKSVSNLESNSMGTSKDEEENSRNKMSIDEYMKKETEKKVPKIDFYQRKKRNAIIGDNDAIDYLLTLMEYMLKMNNPLKSKSVTDGIDLLMDAIRRAPNIKPIKKAFLEPISISPVPIKFIEKDLSKSNSESQDDNVSFFKNQTDFVKDNVLGLNEQNNDTENIASNFLGEDFGEDKVVIDSQTPKSAKVPASLDKFEKNIDFEEDLGPDLKYDKPDKPHIKTFKPYERYTIKKQQTEDPYNEIDDLKLKMSNDVIPETNPKTTTEKKYDTSIVKNINDQEPNKVIQTTARTDTTKSEIENENPVEISKIVIKNKKNKKVSRTKSKSRTNISSFTKEISDGNLRKKLDEEELLRKHILSSEDYDTMKSMDDESLSGDLSPFDPVNNEAFPSYFS